MWGGDFTIGPGNRLPQSHGAQVHRLPTVHVRLRLQNARRAHGDSGAGEEDGGGQCGQKRRRCEAITGDCLREAGEAEGGAEKGGRERGQGGRGLGEHDRGAGATGCQLSTVSLRVKACGLGEELVRGVRCYMFGRCLGDECHDT